MSPKNPFCSLCLSCDRKLSFSDVDVNVFCKYFSEIKITSPLEHFCFECISMLRKMEQFKKKVMLAQQLMNLQCSGSFSGPIKSLSTLSCHLMIDSELIIKEENLPSPESLLTPKLEEQSIQETIDIKVEIKTENEETKNLNEDDIKIDYADNIYVDDVKNIKYELELLPIPKASATEQVKREKKRKRLQYKNNYVYVYTQWKNRYMESKTIDKVELNEAMDKERSGIIYQNLKYKCLYENCLYGSDVKEKFDEHLESHNFNNCEDQCEICKVWCTDQKSLLVHTKSHFTLSVCKICGAVSCDADAVLKHIDNHLNVVKCVHCGENFDDANSCMKHKQLMHNTFICDICGIKRTTKEYIAQHIHLGHKEPEKISCNICSKEFKLKSSYTKHYNLKHVTQPDEQSFCVLCNKQFDNVYLYNQHIKTNVAHAHEWKNGRKTYPCSECDKVYLKNVYRLNHYMFVHKNQPKYSCKLCGKKCLNRASYMTHKAHVHEGKVNEKNKHCTICDRGFHTNKTLKNHMRTHTGERPFKCELCHSNFGFKQALNNHIKRIHDKVQQKTNEQK